MDILVSDTLWASTMLPEGLVEKWRVADGDVVAEGEVLVDLRIEDALHEVMAPAGGRLTICAEVNSVIEPGALLGRLAS